MDNETRRLLAGSNGLWGISPTTGQTGYDRNVTDVLKYD